MRLSLILFFQQNNGQKDLSAWWKEMQMQKDWTMNLIPTMIAYLKEEALFTFGIVKRIKGSIVIYIRITSIWSVIN